mmetsp:Transcript_4119/g.6882  ORF Transcript_4119/g.6882 Transcript_4119/m.6882 type:complete len:217 (+) Transcript_4119:735-1385(+)
MVAGWPWAWLARSTRCWANSSACWAACCSSSTRWRSFCTAWKESLYLPMYTSGICASKCSLSVICNKVLLPVLMPACEAVSTRVSSGIVSNSAIYLQQRAILASSLKYSRSLVTILSIFLPAFNTESRNNAVRNNFWSLSDDNGRDGGCAGSSAVGTFFFTVSHIELKNDVAVEVTAAAPSVKSFVTTSLSCWFEGEPTETNFPSLMCEYNSTKDL